jgi:hypothetical protein
MQFAPARSILLVCSPRGPPSAKQNDQPRPSHRQTEATIRRLDQHRLSGPDTSLPRNLNTTRRTRRTRRQVNQHKALQYINSRRVCQVRRIDLKFYPGGNFWVFR